MGDLKRRRITNEASSAPTSNLIDNLTDDLLVEILQRLPCQSAVQCKSVSKRWCALISHPYFIGRSIHHHHNHNRSDSFSQPLTLFFQGSKRRYVAGNWTISNELVVTSSNPVFKSPEFYFDFLPCFQAQEPQSICVVASFNDLLVCCKRQSVYYICNPLTKEWLALPPAPRRHKVTTVGFVCDPSYCDKQKGCTTNAHYRFKVVRIPKFRGLSTLFNVEIFCSETGEWSESPVSSPQGMSYLDFSTGVVGYKGLLHWVSDSGRSVVACDPFKNVKQCRFIYPPIQMINCIGVCRGRLRICQLTTFDPFLDDGGPNLSVWELEDYNAGKWCLKHKIWLTEMVSDNSRLVKEAKSFMPYVVVLAFHPHDGDIMYLIIRRGLVLCNMRTRTLELANDSELQRAIKEISCCLLWSNVFPLVHQWWPTPVPPLRPNALPC